MTHVSTVGMIHFQVSCVFFFLGGGKGVCLIFLVVKLLTGFQAFVLPVKDFTHCVSVVIFIVPMLKL